MKGTNTTLNDHDKLARNLVESSDNRQPAKFSARCCLKFQREGSEFTMMAERLSAAGSYATSKTEKRLSILEK